ncbi:MAG: nitrilase-related carbon-nitrogen hydrolase, partial [Sediminispirochaetaceae bacterium]
MKIGYFQFAPVFGDVEKNRARIIDAVGQSDAELLVIPELATSGYFFSSTSQVERMAEPIPGPTTDALAEAASRTGCTIVTGLPERDGDTLYNSAVAVGPDGIIGSYRKIHLFSEEKIHFSPGNDGFLLFELNGIRVGVLVCFDHM